MNSKISYAVAAILGGASCAAIPAARAADTNAAEAGSEGLVEVTVTAQRRTENMQDVPISMQALTQQTLQQLNVSTLDDYLKYLPNVTTANNGPGQNEIFMRGLSAGSQPSQGSASTGLWPNVAIYLDNQSGQLPNRNLDIYAADLNRIEVLDGPQGTLYGAGAEAGVIRYITNEPKLDVVEGNVTAGYGTDRARRPQHRRDGSPQPAADRRAPGGSRGGLQRPPRRLHRQRAGDLHAQEHGRWHPLRPVSGGQRPVPGRPAEQRLVRAAWQSEHQQRLRRRTGDQPGHLPGLHGWRRCTSSTTTGTR